MTELWQGFGRFPLIVSVSHRVFRGLLAPSDGITSEGYDVASGMNVLGQTEFAPYPGRSNPLIDSSRRTEYK